MQLHVYSYYIPIYCVIIGIRVILDVVHSIPRFQSIASSPSHPTPRYLLYLHIYGYQTLDRAQQDRVTELLADLETSSPDRPMSPAKNQQLRQRQSSRPSLSLNIRKFFRLRGGEEVDDSGAQNGGNL